MRPRHRNFNGSLEPAVSMPALAVMYADRLLYFATFGFSPTYSCEVRSLWCYSGIPVLTNPRLEQGLCLLVLLN